MPVDPDTLTRFESDGLIHEIVTVADDDPPLAVTDWFRSTMKCGLTCDCPTIDLDDTLRFRDGAEVVTCPGCLV